MMIVLQYLLLLLVDTLLAAILFGLPFVIAGLLIVLLIRRHYERKEVKNDIRARRRNPAPGRLLPANSEGISTQAYEPGGFRRGDDWFQWDDYPTANYPEYDNRRFSISSETNLTCIAGSRVTSSCFGVVTVLLSVDALN
jgi:hypothetical protein